MVDGKRPFFIRRGWIRFLTPALGVLLIIPAAFGQSQSEIEITFTSPPPGHPQLELSKLTPEKGDALLKVADKYTLYVVAAKTLSEGDPEMDEYLFDRLPLSALMLKELKLGNYNIYEQSPNKYHWIDPKGVFGQFHLVYKEPGKRIYYGSGFYDGKAMPRIDGEAIMIFVYHPAQGQSGRIMENEVYAYIKVDNYFFSTVTRVLRPLLPALVREKMNGLFLNSKALSEWIARDPADVYRRLEGTGRVPREELLEFKAFFLDNERRK